MARYIGELRLPVAMCIGESATQAPGAPRRLRRFKTRSLEAPGRLRRLKNRSLEVLSPRTSKFWRPDLGYLETKNLDSLENYSLVAKNVLSTAWWPHKGASGFEVPTEAHFSYTV